jgi:hypothetical protein
MSGRWKSWLLQKKAVILESFEMFIALRAGLAGEVGARSDFKARAAVFFTDGCVIGWFLIRKSLKIDFRE